MKHTMTVDSQAFTINGKDSFMVSGEFHYFRVPKTDWRRRMKLFREAGGTTLATYVPWIIHEPEEGTILFDDIPERDISDYLKIADEEGLQVTLRPGPYQYSELVCAGLPEWLVSKNEILAKNVHGTTDGFGYGSVSYLHPLFLSYARKYYKAFAEVVRPYLSENGGPVTMIQVDNEMTGVHLWSGDMDYNPESMGFGNENGRWPNWLKNKYGDISTLNSAWETDFPSIAEAMPADSTDVTSKGSVIRSRDYFEFYLSSVAEYASILAGWLREDGINEIICTNAANPHDNPYIQVTKERLGNDFLLGSDHYYCLSQSWNQNNPTPQYALGIMQSLDELRAMGLPPTVFELPGGSCSDTPPMLSEDLLSCYMTNTAFGMKGMNYYIYTGGPNFGDTGGSCDIYDYHAFVSADGKINDTYKALKAFGDFMNENPWLQRSERVASVQIGFDWKQMRQRTLEYSGLKYTIAESKKDALTGVMYTLTTTGYSGEFVCLDHIPDPAKPLILVSPSELSETAQKNVCEFVEKGGHLLVMPVLPDYGTDYKECSMIKDRLFGNVRFGCPQESAGYLITEDGLKAYGMHLLTSVEASGAGWNTLARSRKGESVCVISEDRKVAFLGCSWQMSVYSQSELLEYILNELGACRCVVSSNRNIITSLRETSDGKRMLFAMNLFSGRNSTEFSIIRGEQKNTGKVDFEPMQVKTFIV